MYKQGSENNQNEQIISPLVNVSDFTLDFPPEYLHSVLLGSFKTLISFFIRGVKGQRFPCKITSSIQDIMNKEVEKVRKCVPNNFQRKIRPFNYFEQYKGTELRQLLLYFGPYIFKHRLPTPYYENFLHLHYAIYCLCSPNCKSFIDVAQYCINEFLQGFERLFGKDFQTYNNHMISHLPFFVNKLGPLDSFSSFPFESYLGLLKRKTKNSRYVFSQTLSNLLNLRELCGTTNEDLNVTAREPNNCVLLKNGTVIFANCVTNNVVIGTVLKFHENLYDCPYPSSSHAIGFYILTEEVMSGEIKNKCIAVPLSEQYLIMPFCSNYNFAG